MLAAAAGAALVVTAPSAWATGTWSRPSFLGPHTSSWEASVATNSRGDAAAVWVQTPTTPYQVAAAVRPAGGAWSDAAVLSGPSTWNPSPPFVGVDRAGDAVVVWWDNGDLFAADHPAGGAAWTPSQRIGADPAVALSIAPNGAATVLAGSSGSVYALDRTRNGSWGGPVPIASGAPLGAAGLAMTGNGAAIAVYETWRSVPRPIYRTDFVVHAVRRAALGAGWGADMVLTPPLPQRYGHATVVGLDSAGAAVLVGRQLDGAGTELTQQVVTQPAAGRPWTAPVTLSAAGTSAGYAALGVTPAGTTSITWTAGTAANSTVELVTGQLPHPSWTPAQTLSDPGVAVGYPAIAVNARGDAVVTWTALDQPATGRTSLQAVERARSSGTWSRPTTIGTSPTGLSNAVTALDAAGTAVSVWNQTPAGWIGQSTRTADYLP